MVLNLTLCWTQIEFHVHENVATIHLCWYCAVTYQYGGITYLVTGLIPSYEMKL